MRRVPIVVALLAPLVLAVARADPAGAKGCPGDDGAHADAAAGSWQRLSLLRHGFGGDVGPRDVEWIDHRFLLFGTAISNGQGSAALWRSRDGRSWRRLAGREVPPAAFLDTGAFFRGATYLFGSDASGQPTVWRSSNGSGWEAIALPGARGFLAGAVVHRGRLVAYSQSTGGSTIRWSDDGTHWQSNAASRDDVIVSMVSFRGRLLALARTDSNLGRLPATDRVLTSTDGTAWQRGASLGYTVDPGVETLGVWRGRVWASTYPRNFDFDENSSRLWVSSDGRQWHHAGTGPRGSTFDRLTNVGSHLVATGFTTASRPGAWISEDAANWQPMHVPRPPGGRLDLTATDGRVLVGFNSGGVCDLYRWRATRAGHPA